MTRLKIKYWRSLLSFIVGIVLFQGCHTETMSTQYSFIESVQVVEIDTDTKSFRIVVERVEDYDSNDYVPVFLDTKNTTARHDFHFINHIEPPFSSIGVFKPMDSDDMLYRDVELRPDNITSEVSIYYYIGNVRIDLNERLEVILRPKAKKN